MSPRYKPTGGVESATLYPADAVASALFSSSSCEVQFSSGGIEVELIDDLSSLEEVSKSHYGANKVTHRLTLVAGRNEGEKWLDEEFVERCSIEGVVAEVHLCDGRTMLVGYSAIFGGEQPLRLESLTYNSGTSLHDTPTLSLELVSEDSEFSKEIV
jgi:hypothetical protein